MIRIYAELDIHGLGIKKVPLGTVEIYNDGTGGTSLGNYGARVLSKNGRPLKRRGAVLNYPRLTKPIWCLVYRALGSLGYK